MKRIQYSAYGDSALMRLGDFELRAPGKGEVGVKINFAAINPIDWKVRIGNLRMVTGNSFPRGMGTDFSGTVISVGQGVTRFKLGDEVFGLAPIKGSGAFAQAAITNENFLALKPSSVSFEKAACLGTPGVTAWNGVIDKAKLVAGKHVFVNGCTGGVGEAAVQISQMFGANVSGSCSAENMQRARVLDLQNVYDYRTTDLRKLNERYDVVYDTAAVMTTDVGVGLLRKKGVFLDINPTPGKFVRSLVDSRVKPVICTPRADILDNLARAADKGTLQLPIAEIVSLREATTLIAALETGHKLNGKGLIAME